MAVCRSQVEPLNLGKNPFTKGNNHNRALLFWGTLLLAALRLSLVGWSARGSPRARFFYFRVFLRGVGVRPAASLRS